MILSATTRESSAAPTDEAYTLRLPALDQGDAVMHRLRRAGALPAELGYQQVALMLGGVIRPATPSNSSRGFVAFSPSHASPGNPWRSQMLLLLPQLLPMLMWCVCVCVRAHVVCVCVCVCVCGARALMYAQAPWQPQEHQLSLRTCTYREACRHSHTLRASSSPAAAFVMRIASTEEGSRARHGARR